MRVARRVAWTWGAWVMRMLWTGTLAAVPVGGLWVLVWLILG
jgi:hypothetical protein